MVYLGADHNGFWLKEELKEYLRKHKIPFKDLGASSLRKSDDYPEFGSAVAKRIGSGDLGILICGSGHGMAIVANKIRGIRAALASSVFSARKAREDDHANVLALSSWETTVEKAKRIVATWLSTRPSKAGRHLRRLKKIQRLER
jgi:ribose 5-phosphate isomerase B